MKKAFIALALFLLAPASLTAVTSPATAAPNIDFDIYFGQPHYRYSPGNGYVFRRGYGWYLPDRYYRERPNRQRVSCNTAKRLVRDRGYRIVSTRDCQGSQYIFRVRRNGNTFWINVNSRTGAVWRS